MKTSIIAILAALVTTVSAQEFRAPIGRQKPVRAMETPPPVSPKVEGVLPKAFGPGRNPLQMLNPWAPARYRELGGEYIIRSRPPRKMERH